MGLLGGLASGELGGLGGDESGGGGSGVQAITVNDGPLLTDDPVALQITKQPVAQPNGIVQPLPPLFGFAFDGSIIIPATTCSAGQGIALGFDGNLWQCDNGSSPASVVVVDNDGNVLQTINLGLGSNPGGITAAPDGNMWVADQGRHTVWRINTITFATDEFFLDIGSFPYEIVAGPDGNLWTSTFDSATPNQGGVWRITTAGVATFFPVGNASSEIEWVTNGPDGNLWVSDLALSGMWKLDPLTGDTTFVALPGGSQPQPACTGPDGNIWVVDVSGNNTVYQVSPHLGLLNSFVITGATSLFQIASGGGGDLWIVDGTGVLWKLTVFGQIASFPCGSGDVISPQWLCINSDGAFALSGAGSIITFTIMSFILRTATIFVTQGDVAILSKDGLSGLVCWDTTNNQYYRINVSAGNVVANAIGPNP